MERPDSSGLPVPTTDLEVRLVRELLLLREENALLRARLEALEEKSNRHSGNSNQPPSSDGPSAPERKKRGGSGKRRGGQRGHPGHQRSLVPPEQVDRMEERLPGACAGCGGKRLTPTQDPPKRHQVWDVPSDIRASVTEFQLFSACCLRCETVTQAGLPPGTPLGQFGPRIQGWVGYLSGEMRLSDRQIQEILLNAFRLEISLGAVAKLRQRVSDSLAAPVGVVREFVQKQPAVHADETSWNVASTGAWLWVAVTRLVAVFLIRPGRNAETARELLGIQFTGTLTSDRLKSYGWVANWQSCWAHLLRLFSAIAGRSGKPGKLGRKLERLGREVFTAWHRHKAGEIQRATLQRRLRPLRKAFGRYFEWGTKCGHRETEGQCRQLLADEVGMWTFAYVEGVEPTNNLAEQMLRHGVIWRKLRHGTQSDWGSRFAERVLTTSATLKLQGRNVLDYLVQAAQARLAGASAPSLLPA